MHPTIILFFALFVTFSVGYVGDITVFHPGSGAKVGICGWDATDENAVVAISAGMMNDVAGADPKSNKKCGSDIKIWNPVTRETWKATIIDTCKDCGYMDLALSPRLFLAVAKSTNPHGRVVNHGIAWGGDVVGG